MAPDAAARAARSARRAPAGDAGTPEAAAPPPGPLLHVHRLLGASATESSRSGRTATSASRAVERRAARLARPGGSAPAGGVSVRRHLPCRPGRGGRTALSPPAAAPGPSRQDTAGRRARRTLGRDRGTDRTGAPRDRPATSSRGGPEPHGGRRAPPGSRRRGRGSRAGRHGSRRHAQHPACSECGRIAGVVDRGCAAMTTGHGADSTSPWPVTPRTTPESPRLARNRPNTART